MTTPAQILRAQSFSILVAFHDLARAGLTTDLGRLSGRTGLSIDETEAALARLGAVGLVAPAWPRLTMRGLALATTLVMEREQRREESSSRAA